MILEDDSFNGVEYLEIDYLFWNSWKRITISVPLNKRENFAVAAINDTEIVILGGKIQYSRVESNWYFPDDDNFYDNVQLQEQKPKPNLDELLPLIFNTED